MTDARTPRPGEGLSMLARRVVRSGRADAPPQALQAAILTQIAVEVGIAQVAAGSGMAQTAGAIGKGVGEVATGSTAAPAALGATWVGLGAKWAGLGFVTGGLLVGAAELAAPQRTGTTTSPVATVVSLPTTAASLPTTAAGMATQTSLIAVGSASAASPTQAPALNSASTVSTRKALAPRDVGDRSARATLPAPTRASTHRGNARLARQEALGVAEARAELRSGQALAALGRLERLDAEVPGGALRQEREALRVEALLAAGRGASARRAARDFVDQHPESPQARRLRPLAGEDARAEDHDSASE